MTGRFAASRGTPVEFTPSDLTRPGKPPATDEPGVGDSVVWGAEGPVLDKGLFGGEEPGDRVDLGYFQHPS